MEIGLLGLEHKRLSKRVDFIVIRERVSKRRARRLRGNFIIYPRYPLNRSEIEYAIAIAETLGGRIVYEHDPLSGELLTLAFDRGIECVPKREMVFVRGFDPFRIRDLVRKKPKYLVFYGSGAHRAALFALSLSGRW